MKRTASVLKIAQLGRATISPSEEPEKPLSSLFFEGVRQRNAALDGLYYNVGEIRDEEAAQLSPWLAEEGAILIVPPGGGDDLTIFPSADAFIAAGGTDINVLTIAGVGSSALGSAGFARDVANACGEPVAAVVSGYGMTDLWAEALGGYFWFGWINRMRHLEQGGKVSQGRMIGGSALADLIAAGLRESEDVRTICALLRDERVSLEMLVGHSKGNLVLSEALYQFNEESPQDARALAQRVRIITFSARVAMPRPFRDITDVMGGLDWFGEFNSHPDIGTDVTVPGAGHHTNVELPRALPVTETLRGIL